MEKNYKTYKVMNATGLVKEVNASELPKYIAMGWKEVKDINSVNSNPYTTYVKK